jgi:hypothetical protein
MFSFFKKKEPVVRVPQWSRIANSSDYIIFKKAVEHYFADYNACLNFNDGVVHLEETEMFGVDAINLINLFRYCLSQGKSETFLPTIEEFLGNMRREANAGKASPEFEKAKDTLGLRILTVKLFEQMSDEFYIGAQLFENLFYFLVFDLPDTVTNVSHADAAPWGVSHHELLKIGKRNTASKYPQAVALQEILELKIWTVENEYFYAPNILLDIEEHPNLIGAHGSLIIVPSGDRLFIYPIEGIEVTDAIRKLAVVAKFFYEDKPNPISPDLYWYRNGRYITIPYNIEHPDFTTLPDAFVSMIRDLS